MKRSIKTAIVLGAFALTLTGCNSAPKQENAGGAAAPINTTCPFSGEKVDGKTTSTFNGKTIAFCCAGCKGKFDKADAKAQADMVSKVTPK